MSVQARCERKKLTGSDCLVSFEEESTRRSILTGAKFQRGKCEANHMEAEG